MKLFLFLSLMLFCSCNKENDDNPEFIEPDEVLVNAFPNVTFRTPVDFQIPNDETSRMFIVEKSGSIKIIDQSNLSDVSTFINLESIVSASGEQGLLGLAFHPNFENNGFFYVYYNPNQSTTNVSRFKVSDGDSNLADPNSEFILLSFFQDATNHNGGQLTFGTDGYLYISSGDGGKHENGQNLSNLTGNILRIDVDTTSPGLNYSIPIDNPFVSDSDKRDEIYAYGLRNPWRMSFDRSTNVLWTGDVGALEIEEVNIIVKGGNYGWSMFEGSECRFGPCDYNGPLVFPFFEYQRSQNGGAITGGYVYRGTKNPQLFEKYVYGDFVTGQIWALDINTGENSLIYNSNLNISGFGLDADNELYILNYSGSIYNFIPE